MDDTKYSETSLENILDFWVKHYELPEGQRVARWEWFIHPQSNRVVLKLHITDRPDPLE
jgi:hypothetical protein